MKDAPKANVASENQESNTGFSRRKFLTYAGSIAGAGALLAACNKDDNGFTPPADNTIDIGSNDKGLMNLAFAFQQIEASFYETVLANEYVGMSEEERKMFTYMHNHEITHREFMRERLQGTGTLLETEFPNVKFNDKSSVLENAKLIEDTVVAAMNGIAGLLFDTNNVMIIMKMASVEARQASYISDLRTKGTFDSTTDINGMEPETAPNNAITIANRYLKTKISGKNLPS